MKRANPFCDGHGGHSPRNSEIAAKRPVPFRDFAGLRLRRVDLADSIGYRGAGVTTLLRRVQFGLAALSDNVFVITFAAVERIKSTLTERMRWFNILSMRAGRRLRRAS